MNSITNLNFRDRFTNIDSKYKYILLGIVIGLIGYYVYNYFKGENYTSLFKDEILLNNKYYKFVSNLYLPPSNIGRKFTYSFWIKIRNIPENSSTLNSSYTENKNILNRFKSPQIMYNIKNNSLVFIIKYKNNDIFVDYKVEVEDLKLQTWNHVALTLNNRTVNVYINHELLRSGIIDSVPFLFEKNIDIGEVGKINNFNGYLKDGRYYNRDLTHEEIKSL
jgi:hypothetical protein